MARIDTYDKKFLPAQQTTNLGQTAKLSGSDQSVAGKTALASAKGQVAQSYGQLGNSIADVGKVLFQFQEIKDLKTENRFKTGLEWEKAYLIEKSQELIEDEDGNLIPAIPVEERPMFIEIGMGKYFESADLSGISNAALDRVNRFHLSETTQVVHQSKMQAINFELQAALVSQEERYSLNMQRHYDAKRAGNEEEAESYRLRADGDLKNLAQMAGPQNANNLKKQGYFNYVRTALSGATHEDDVKNIWDNLDPEMLDVGGKEALVQQKEATLRGIESARNAQIRQDISNQTKYANEAINAMRRGEFVDVSQIPELLNAGVINKVGAQKIEYENWKLNSGEPTDANKISFGETTSDINRGKITSFSDLEARMSSMTPEQYEQAETALAERLSIPAGAEKAKSYIRKVSGKTATVKTLYDLHNKLLLEDMPLETKEAISVLMEKAFRLNKNPELSSAYNNAIADILELERYLDLPTGTIAHRLSVEDNLSLDEVVQRRDSLKKVFDERLQKKIKENMATFSFGLTTEAGEDDVVNWGDL